MTIDVASFKAFIPAMKTVQDSTVQAHLTAAALLITEDVYGDLREQALFYQAAHRIALDPGGIGARLNPKDSEGQTTYGAHLHEIQLAVGAFCIVAGGYDCGD